MDRRSYLKTSLTVGGSLLIPTGVMALAGCSGTARTPEVSGFDGRIMGTSYSVRLAQTPDDALAQQIHAVLQDVDANMSTWRGESELSLLNVSTDSDWQPMTAATTQVIAHALDASVASHGAFDATVSPLVDLWGFGAGAAKHGAGARGKKPQGQEIRQIMASVGHDAIEVDMQANAVRKLTPTAQLDLSGIAKGHAVDRVAGALDAAGITDYLVEVGGELKARGRKPDGSAWRVAIERPVAGQRDVFRAINLVNRAIATSGDYRNFFDNDGQRYSHSIDPRTGAPVGHELASVSVVAESTMAADALSTTLMVLGPDDAMAFARRHQIAAHLILKSSAGLEERYSEAFEHLLT